MGRKAHLVVALISLLAFLGGISTQGHCGPQTPSEGLCKRFSSGTRVRLEVSLRPGSTRFQVVERKKWFDLVACDCVQESADGVSSDAYKSLAERVLRAAGYEVVGGDAKNADIGMRIVAQSLRTWCDHYDPPIHGSQLRGKPSHSWFGGTEVKGEITLGAKRSRNWTVPFEGRCSLSAVRLAQNPSPERLVASFDAAFWQSGSFAHVLIRTIATTLGGRRVASLLQDENPLLRGATARVLADTGDRSLLDDLRQALEKEHDGRVKAIIERAIRSLERPA